MLFNLPHICIESEFPSLLTLNQQRAYVIGRQSEVLTDSTLIPTGISIVTGSATNFMNSTLETNSAYTKSLSEINVQADINSVVENKVEWVEIRVSTDDRTDWDVVNKQCKYSYYGYFWNSQQFNSRSYTYIRRFESSYRVKIIVDDENVAPPNNIKNIEDIFPVIGLKKVLKINDPTN
jgi:hypothetical protein